MVKRNYLGFIDDEDLKTIITEVLEKAKSASDQAETRLYTNVVDPFSAIFDSCWQGVDLDNWLEQEKTRQAQKTLQNALGDFHQSVLGAMDGWEDLGTGSVVDLKNGTGKVIAEVKNKFNTTKGNHKVRIYDDFEKLLNSSPYSGFKAYYVEIIPRKPEQYNKLFTPPDNQTKTRRPKNVNIRVIDGKSFYELASGDPNALKKLFEALPKVIKDSMGATYESEDIVTSFKTLFTKAYG